MLGDKTSSKKKLRIRPPVRRIAPMTLKVASAASMKPPEYQLDAEELLEYCCESNPKYLVPFGHGTLNGTACPLPMTLLVPDAVAQSILSECMIMARKQVSKMPFEQITPPSSYTSSLEDSFDPTDPSGNANELPQLSSSNRKKPTSNLLKKHRRIPPPDIRIELVNGRKTWSCMASSCKKTYNTAAGLKYHLKAVHGQSPGCLSDFTDYKCIEPGCGKVYSSRTGLKYHCKTSGHPCPEPLPRINTTAFIKCHSDSPELISPLYDDELALLLEPEYPQLTHITFDPYLYSQWYLEPELSFTQQAYLGLMPFTF